MRVTCHLSLVIITQKMIKIEYFETKNTMNLKNFKNFDTGLALDLFDNDIDDIK